MTSDQWQKVEALYRVVYDCDPGQRAELMAQAEPEVRREVERLLEQRSHHGLLDGVAMDLVHGGEDAPTAFHAPVMRLAPGSALGPYRVVAALGVGGMGEVYSANDTKLERLVALKVLPSRFSSDPDRLARMKREARVLASLNHPNIASIYGLEDRDGVQALVLELVEGPTLADRLRKGPIPVAEAMPIARQIADGLDAAHERGIVHRDLKPANIKLRPDGTVKVLDFGLAKALEPSDGGPHAPTLTAAAHAVVGTAAYMSPEQARGRSVDKRTDIWAFGCVLYETLTGRRPFQGEDSSETIAAVMTAEPDWTALPPDIPPALETFLRRCLRKDPKERVRDIGDLRLALDGPSETVASTPGTTRPRPEASDLVTAEHVNRAPRRRAWLVGGSLALVVLAAAVTLIRSSWTAPPAHQIRSVAVLPLENLSGDPEQEYFADGMTEQLITDLAKISGLRVISRTSVMQYRKARKPLPEIARELKVDAIIEGAVARAGDKVRVTAKLIRGATEQSLWAQSYERDLRDVLALQSDVARSIANQVDITLTPQEQQRLASARPVNPEAHQQVLIGRFHANKGTEDGLRKAIQYFDLAISKDSANGLAHAGLAEAYAATSSYYMHPREAMPKAKAAAGTALKLDDSLASAHAALGYIHLLYDWDGPAAEKELLKAIHLDPSLAAARLNYAAYLTTQGRYDEAAQEVRRSADLDPLSVRTHSFGALFLIFARRYDEAIELARKGLELEPNGAYALAFQGLAYGEQRRFKEAVSNLQRAAQLERSPTILYLGAHIHAVAGQREEAERLIHEGEKATERQYFCPYEIATAYVSLRDFDTAYNWFRKGVEARADCMAWLGVEPWMEPFRSDPRYATLLQEVGIDPQARAGQAR
jgi:serine/threonine protein kinase/tetratricopeptide (TPR) repeat protein